MTLHTKSNECNNVKILKMKIIKNQSLKKFNTFGLESVAAEFEEIVNISDLEIAANYDLPIKILGGGSNILLTGDIEAVVIKNSLKGIYILEEDSEYVYIKAAGGENWHEFVLWCIERNFAGVENLSLIPGTVGAAPIQNIGAYGVELKDVFYELEAVELSSGLTKTFSWSDCRFGYRDSIFKQELKGLYFICSVTFRLSKQPIYKISYGDIQNIIGDRPLSIKIISDAVIQIRSSKLPDPKIIGNAGSFFKNPVIAISLFQSLIEKHPSLPSYPTDIENNVKIPAGWLIEQAGWKGRRIGNIGVHEKQALVLVNYGNGKGSEIWQLAKDIQADIFSKFAVNIEPEVNVW